MDECFGTFADQNPAMLKTRRIVAPAGTLIKTADLSSGMKQVYRGETVYTQYRKQICHYLSVKHAFLVNSGKTALTVILQVLKDLSGRQEVLIPPYTCFSVPSAIVRAGLRIRLCDIDLGTLDFNKALLEKVVDEKVLAIVPSNLFGLVSDIPKITSIAKTTGAYVIDDAAQSFGAGLNGVKSGAMGDVGILSLGRGKNITTYEGGVIITDSEKVAKRLMGHPFLRLALLRKWPVAGNLLGLLLYSVFLHPRFYWIPNALPFLRLGESIFDPGFKMGSFSEFQCALGLHMLKKLDQLNAERRRNAHILSETLKHHPKLILPKPLDGSHPVYLRFPILVMNPVLREKIYHELLQEGIGVSKMYPTAIHHIPGIRPYLANVHEQFPNAELVASSILTLPTHSLVTKKDLDLMFEVVDRCTQ